MEQKSIDYSPLHQEVSWTQALAYAKKNVIQNITGVLSLAFASFIVFSMVSIAFVLFIYAASTGEITSLYIGVGILLFCVFVITVSLFNTKTSVTTQLRMQDFANTNNFTVIRNLIEPTYPGVIFGDGDTRVISEGYVLPVMQNAEIGNYTYMTGSGKSRQSHTYGYMKIPLPRNLPHMLLDAKSNNLFGRFSNLPMMFSNDQKLQLEGDFNNYFTLYAPKEYETDALYIFTPDVMQALISSSKEYDVEIIDGSLFLYSNDYFDMTKQQEIEELFYVISSLSKDIFKQSNYYADERVGDRTKNIVASKGRRLNSSHWPITIGGLFFVGYFAFWLFADGGISIGDIVFIIIAIITVLWLFTSLFRRK